MKANPDSAHVYIPPPLIGLACVLIGVGIQLVFPLHWISVRFQWVLAGFLIVTGMTIFIGSAFLFKKAHTDIKPWEPTTRIIKTGVYRFSRNPIYLSFVLFIVGLASAFDNFWILLMTIPFVMFLDRYVITREERYLNKKFGKEYHSYANKVRRWL